MRILKRQRGEMGTETAKKTYLGHWNWESHIKQEWDMGKKEAEK